MAMDMKEMIKWTIADLITRQLSQEGPKEAGKKAAGLVTPNIIKKFLPPDWFGGKVIDSDMHNAQQMTAALGGQVAPPSGTNAYTAAGTPPAAPATSTMAAPGGIHAPQDIYGIAGEGGKTAPMPFSAETAATGAVKGTAKALAFGEEAGGAGAVLGSLGGPAAMAADGLVKLVGATIAIKDFGDAMVESNRHLGKWNGQLAVANAKYDIQGIKLEAQTAQATGGSASTLTGQQMQLRDEFQPISEDLASLKNIAATGIVEIGRGLNLILRLVDTVVGPVIKLVEFFMGGQGKQQESPLATLFAFLEQGQRLNNVRNPDAPQGARAVKPGGGVAGAGGGMGPAAAGGGAAATAGPKLSPYQQKLAANRAAYNQRMADNRSAYAAQHPGGGGGGGGGAGGGGGLRANRALQGKVPDAPAAGIIHDEKEGS